MGLHQDPPPSPRDISRQRESDGRTDGQSCRETDRQKVSQIDIQTNNHAERQIDRHRTYRQTERQS